jgi:hypothetical protein
MTTTLHSLLKSHSDVEIVDQVLLRQTPWLFASATDFLQWRRLVAAGFAVKIDSVFVVGSAATGFSLSPYKPGHPFRVSTDDLGSPSDVDLAIVSPALFVSAWDAIVSHDRTRQLRWSFEDHRRVRQNIYWGLVSSDRVPRNTDPSRRMLGALAAAARERPVRGHVLKCRVYRRADDLRAYHIDSLRALRTAVREASEDRMNGQ